jgi:acetyl-CoA acetyltransferase
VSRAGIIGYGWTAYEKRPSRTEFGYLAEAARRAIESASVAKSEVDGLHLSSSTIHPENAVTTAERFGLSLSWAHVSTSASAGSVAGVLDSLRAIEAGAARYVLCLAGGAQDLAGFRERVARFNSSIRDYVLPHGFGGLNGMFGIVTRKHMETYGTERRQLGRIAVDLRSNALLNEQALFREPLSLDQYLNAPVIADPLRLYDCVLPCSGAEAVLLGPLDRVAPEKRVRVLAGGQRHNHPVGEIAPIRGGWELFRDDLYREGGYGPEEMDFLQAYDDYPVMVAIQIEDLGFCPKGEVGSFLERRSLTWDGDFPVNTGGGQLSMGQSGGGGGLVGVVEAVRQLRGEAGPRQMAGVERGMVSGYGMVAYGHGLSASALVVGRDGGS